MHLGCSSGHRHRHQWPPELVPMYGADERATWARACYINVSMPCLTDGSLPSTPNLRHTTPHTRGHTATHTPKKLIQGPMTRKRHAECTTNMGRPARKERALKCVLQVLWVRLCFIARAQHQLGPSPRLLGQSDARAHSSLSSTSPLFQSQQQRNFQECCPFCTLL